MNTLIINTAFDDADYIVISQNKIFSKKATKENKHSECALPFIDGILHDANLSIQDIDIFAINIGPGSFTGIRIGVALVKGFLCALENKKVIAFNSFEPVALSNSQCSFVAIKASRDDYYVAECKNGKIKNLLIMQNAEIEKQKNVTFFNGCYNQKDLINLVELKIQSNDFNSINETNPLYLKLSQAEKELLKKEQNNVD